MPTYVYECSACNTIFEVEQRIIESALDTCINCGSSGTVKRLIQPVGIAFKGSGFHINDYSPSTSASRAKEESAAPGAETDASGVGEKPSEPAAGTTPSGTPSAPASTSASPPATSSE